jgi:hypothetical protein
MTAVLAIASCTLAALTGCDKDKGDKPALAPAASSLAPSLPAPTAKTLEMTIDPKSKTAIDMPAPKEHIKAFTDAAAGKLEVDPANLTASRGEVKMDLSTLTMKHFDDPKDDAAQTTHARCWLEVADCEDQKLDDKTKTANKYAVYAIRSIDHASATDLSKVAPTKDGADEIRKVTMTTHGDLLIHGHKVDGKDADVEVSFRYPAGASADKPTSMTVKSVKPLQVTLDQHDVKPRDNFGKIAKASFHLLGTKVADTADITFDFDAKP